MAKNFGARYLVSAMAELGFKCQGRPRKRHMTGYPQKYLKTKTRLPQVRSFGPRQGSQSSGESIGVSGVLYSLDICSASSRTAQTPYDGISPEVFENKDSASASSIIWTSAVLSIERRQYWGIRGTLQNGHLFCVFANSASAI